MLRRIAIFFVAAGLSVAVHAGYAQPSGKWEVQYSDSACIAKRAYGNESVAIQPSVLGGWTRLTVEGRGRVAAVRQYWSTVEFGDGLPPIKATSLAFPLKERGRRGILTVFADQQVERAFKSGKLGLRSGLKNDPRVLFDNREMDSTSAAFALTDGEALFEALSACMADLKKSWGFVGDELPEPAVRTKSLIPLNQLFTEDDYPVDALSSYQAGDTVYLLLVDERGGIADCSIRQSSGVASLDAMGCQVLTQRARFVPALDVNGQPAKDTYFTSVSWRIEE
jgi:hypothetical protein